MTLSAATCRKIDAALRKWEGCANYLYLDTRGNVTIGVGELVALRGDAHALPLSCDGGSATKDASEGDKLTEYDRVHRLLPARTLGYYRKTATLFVKASYIDDGVTRHVAQFYASLKALYTTARGYPAKFDDMPEALKLVLFDMAFNLGAAGLTGKFPNFNKALRRGDYATAKQHSDRPDVQQGRNSYVAALFDQLIAAAVTTAKAVIAAPPVKAVRLPVPRAPSAGRR